MYIQQDNDPKHTSKKADQWFSDNNIIPMKWPAKFPDPNLIEHLWQQLKAKLQQYDTPPKGVHELQWLKKQSGCFRIFDKS